MSVVWGDARSLDLPDNSVDCIVTSPPYGVGIEYSGYVDLAPCHKEYTDLVRDSVQQMERVLKPSGRLWLNVMPSIPLDGAPARFPLAQVWANWLDEWELSYRDTVIWIQDSFDGSCGWGSWKRPSAPNLRGSYEVVLNYFKPPYKRPVPEGMKAYQDDCDGTPWQDLVRNVWTINPARRKPGAPAPFPEELVERCIRLSTWPGDVVLDPFAGSGTTVRVAERMNRIGIGFDIDAPKG